MSKPRGLRAVAEDERPQPKKPTTIAAAIEASERDLLVTLRAKLAADLDAGVPAHTVPQLMKQLRELDKDIRALDAREADEGGSTASEGHVNDTFDASAI